MKSFAALLIFLAFTTLAYAQDLATMEKRAKEMVTTINNGDVDGYKKFIQSNYTQEAIDRVMKQKIAGPDGETPVEQKAGDGLEARANMYAQLHNDMGKGTITSMTQNGNKLDVKVKGDSGATVNFVFTFLKDSPHLIDGVSVNLEMGR